MATTCCASRPPSPAAIRTWLQLKLRLLPKCASPKPPGCTSKSSTTRKAAIKFASTSTACNSNLDFDQIQTLCPIPRILLDEPHYCAGIESTVSHRESENRT